MSRVRDYMAPICSTVVGEEISSHRQVYVYAGGGLSKSDSCTCATSRMLAGYLGYGIARRFLELRNVENVI